MRKMTKVNNLKRLFIIGLLVCTLLLGFILLSLICIISLPFIYDQIYGEKIIENTIIEVIGNESNPNEIALRVYLWEKSYFKSPYDYYSNTPKFLRKFGIYKIDGEYKVFIRHAPVSWIIHSRLANCEEYSRVFVYLLNKKGIKARFVHAPGEDHAWAEYYYNGIKIVFDPSNDGPVENTKKFAEGKHWSYVESVNIFNLNDRIDVSDEYIERGKLIVNVTKNGNALKDVTVIIYSTYLMKKDPKRYPAPRKVIWKVSNEKGIAEFYLGENEYVVDVQKCYLGIVCLKVQKDAKVSVDSDAVLHVDFSEARISTGPFFWVFIAAVCLITLLLVQKKIHNKGRNKI